MAVTTQVVFFQIQSFRNSQEKKKNLRKKFHFFKRQFRVQNKMSQDSATGRGPLEARSQQAAEFR